MKHFLLFSAIIIFATPLLFSQENSQAVKDLIGKNTQAGIDPYTGINSVFTLKLKGLKEAEQVRNFDRKIIKFSHGKILSCVSDSQTSIITVRGNMDISELKTFIYEQGKAIVPPNGVEILEYKQEYIIEKK